MQDHVYWSPKQIVQSGKYPFSMGQIRHLLLYRHRNGLEAAVKKIGKRLVVNMTSFDALDREPKVQELITFQF